MKRLLIILFASVLSVVFLLAPAVLEARGGHGGRGGGRGGGHHGGFHGGHRGGSQGGYHGGFQGGHHGGFQGGSWGGHHGGYHGGYPGGYPGGPRYYGGLMVGFGAAYYIAPWGWYYPEYYPEYYYNVPPEVYDRPPAIETPPPEYLEPPPATQGSGPGYVFPPPPAASQISPDMNQRRCQVWAPTGTFHNQSRWDPEKQMMEIVSVPNFAWQDYPCE
jgi:hypothetical protein